MTSTQQLYDELRDAYLIQTKDQIQEDIITLMNSDDQELNDKISQIFGKFDKFFPETK